MVTEAKASQRLTTGPAGLPHPEERVQLLRKEHPFFSILDTRIRAPAPHVSPGRSHYGSPSASDASWGPPAAPPSRKRGKETFPLATSSSAFALPQGRAREASSGGEGVTT